MSQSPYKCVYLEPDNVSYYYEPSADEHSFQTPPKK